MNNSVVEYSCKSMEAEGQHSTICRHIFSAYNVLSVCLFLLIAFPLSLQHCS